MSECNDNETILLPKDCDARINGSKAAGIVHYQIVQNEHWEFHEYTGTDHGIDCTIELIENNMFINKKIEGQIKGTKFPKKLVNNNCFSFPLETKTINYGLSSPIAFLLFYVDLTNEIVYYLPIQDYFIANPVLFDTLENNQKTISLHIPCDNILNKNDFDLQQIAKSVYLDGPTRALHKK